MMKGPSAQRSFVERIRPMKPTTSTGARFMLMNVSVYLGRWNSEYSLWDGYTYIGHQLSVE
jgi:hypothetical protein